MKLFLPGSLSLVLLSLVVLGCTGPTTGVSPGTKSQTNAPELEHNTPAATPLPLATADQPTTSEDALDIPDGIVETAKTDLVNRQAISKDQIRVLDAKAVLWPDTSLGCPQPGMAYAQVNTPGYLLLLEASGDQYAYHTDLEDVVILCPDDALPSFPVTPGEIDDGQPWMPVN